MLQGWFLIELRLSAHMQMCRAFCLKWIKKNALLPLTEIQKVLIDIPCSQVGDDMCQAEEVICGVGMPSFSSFTKEDDKGTHPYDLNP